MTRILLMLLLLGAYVPTGYMPAGGAPFRVELCPDASPGAVSLAISSAGSMASMPASSHQHMWAHHHAAGHAAPHGDCPFGSAPAAAAAPALLAYLPPGNVQTVLTLAARRDAFAARAERAHAPRAPPPTLA